MKPIFIFSLPRSGSTLLQRILTTSDEIESTAEPWILLPLFYALKHEGIYAEYSHRYLARAVDDCIENLPKGKEDYYSAIRDFAFSFYGKFGTENRYFVDKTPRYTLICNEIMECFQNAYFIVLTRNPLDVAASMMQTYAGGRWNLFRYKIDLIQGLRNICSILHKEKNNVIHIRYEELVKNPENVLKKLENFLGCKFDPGKLDQIKFKGRMGDQVGVTKYKDISQDPIDSWKRVCCNPFRKYIARKYIMRMPGIDLELLGVDKSVTIQIIARLPFGLKYFISDIILMIIGEIFCWIGIFPYLHKIRKIRKNKITANW